MVFENNSFMHFVPKKRPERKHSRLQNYDYSQDGFFFATICVKNKQEYFGNIENNKMILNQCGQIAQKCWLEIPKHFPHAILDEFIIMPDHVHGIVQINNDIDHGNKNMGDKNMGDKNMANKIVQIITVDYPWFQNRCNQMVPK